MSKLSALRIRMKMALATLNEVQMTHGPNQKIKYGVGGYMKVSDAIRKTHEAAKAKGIKLKGKSKNNTP